MEFNFFFSTHLVSNIWSFNFVERENKPEYKCVSNSIFRRSAKWTRQKPIDTRWTTISILLVCSAQKTGEGGGNTMICSADNKFEKKSNFPSNNFFLWNSVSYSRERAAEFYRRNTVTKVTMTSRRASSAVRFCLASGGAFRAYY